MRGPLVAVAVVLAACGKTPSPLDSGVPDAGSPDAGGPDAGRQCLDPDAGPPVDAGERDGGDFSCAGQTPPQLATVTFTVDGTVTAAGISRNPVDGALVELFNAGGTLLDSELSVDGGRYALTTNVDCAPLDGYLRASKPDAGFYDIYYYPTFPWRRPRAALELVVFDNAARQLVSGFAGVTIQNGTAALALGVDDCAGAPVSGATVTTNPSGDVRYVAGNGLPTSGAMSTSAKGQALVFNLPPGPVTITVNARGQTFRVRTIDARVDAITSTTMTP